MKSAYMKDILRTIKKNSKRFFAIMMITALGITVYAGFYAACRDMYMAADRFYDQQNLFDIRVLSTLGLTEEDVEALLTVSGVEVAEGVYSETVHTIVDGLTQSAEMVMLSSKGLNMPYLLQGELPKNAGEIAVTQKYLDTSGKNVGDSLIIEEDIEDSALLNSNYTITGVVIDPMNIANNEGSTAFRSTSTVDYTFFVTPEDVDTEVFTSVDLRVAGSAGLDTYSEIYKTEVQNVIEAIETQIMEQREQARYDSLVEKAKKEITDAEAKMEKEFADADEEIKNAWAEINQSEKELLDREAELSMMPELDSVRQKLSDGKQELEDAKAQLIEKETEYKDKKEEAQQEIADAYAELNDMDMAQWYVQDRTTIDSYSSLDSDLSSIEAIGRSFPILFLVVAILISLTTMTRMVEEERGLIGTYKALGFGNFAIAWKFVSYALLASLAGGIVGSLFGFIALPKLIIFILDMYIIPNITLSFDVMYGLSGTLLFVISIVGATALACRHELQQTPSELMRPKAPRAGSRIFLERIPFVWNRLKFLNKVTARNLFRYKKRLLMTVVGIAGCTALVLAGFAIRDSVTDLMPKQYEYLYRYDLMVVADEDKFDEFEQRLNSDEGIADYLSVRIESAKVFQTSGESESVQMIVVPSGASLQGYIHTPNIEGVDSKLDDSGVFITQNAANLLQLEVGDTIELQNLKLERCEVTISNVVQNYLGNNVFITQALYESLFGEYQSNAAYAHFSEKMTDETSYVDQLLTQDYILSTANTSALKEQFTTDFAILNYVIYILVVLAAGLAFVVLFTLSNTNISERVRELATIKVLGFFDGEVHAYTNKETLILTLIGVFFGLPLGYVLSGILLASLKMPALQFALMIQPSSYFFAAVISFSFTLVVNLITNRILDRIDMVEALKSVE